MNGKRSAFELRDGKPLPPPSFDAEVGRQVFEERTGNRGLADACAPILAAHAKLHGADVRDIAAIGVDLFEKFDIDTPAAMDQALKSLSIQHAWKP